MQIRIWFLDGVYITVKCDSWMVVSELELIIAQELGIMAPKYFGLYEALATGEERFVVCLCFLVCCYGRRFYDRILDGGSWSCHVGYLTMMTECLTLSHNGNVFRVMMSSVLSSLNLCIRYDNIFQGCVFRANFLNCSSS